MQKLNVQLSVFIIQSSSRIKVLRELNISDPLLRELHAFYCENGALFCESNRFFFAKYRESLALNGFILEKLKYFTCENDPNLAFVKARLHVFIWLNQYKKIRHST